MFAGRQKFDNKLMNETLERFRQIGFSILNNFYAVSAIFQPCNGGQTMEKQFDDFKCDIFIYITICTIREKKSLCMDFDITLDYNR